MTALPLLSTSSPILPVASPKVLLSTILLRIGGVFAGQVTQVSGWGGGAFLGAARLPELYPLLAVRVVFGLKN